MAKIKLTLLIGGKTGEHRVNLISSKYVLPSIDRKKYEVTLLGIDREGAWYLLDQNNYLVNADDPSKIEFSKNNPIVSLINISDEVFFLDFKTGNKLGSTQVFFSLIGGTYAEDGRLQGHLDMLNIPYVGAGVTGSVLGIDKVIMKQVLQQSGIKIARFLSLKLFERNQNNANKILKEFSYPFFIKPANLGSSIGITKVYTRSQLESALDLAFTYDNKIIIEEYIKGREIECAVLGRDDDLFVSIPGEIIPNHDFYTYEAKYIDPNGADIIIPALLSKDKFEELQALAKQAFTALDCAGFGRIDFFLTQDGEFFVNEINTIPGFTNISLYPKLMEASGISYTDLLDRLIEYAFQEKKSKERLKIMI